MTGFSKDVTTNMKVPQFSSPSGNSTIADIGALTPMASTFANLYYKQKEDATEKKLLEMQVQQDNDDAALVEDIVTTKLQMLEQNATPQQLDKMFISKTSSLAPSRRLDVRAKVASPEYGGSSLNIALDREEAIQKEERGRQAAIQKEKDDFAEWGGFDNEEDAVAALGVDAIDIIRAEKYAFDNNNRQFQLETNVYEKGKRDKEATDLYNTQITNNLTSTVDMQATQRVWKGLGDAFKQRREEGKPIDDTFVKETVSGLIDNGVAEIDQVILQVANEANPAVRAKLMTKLPLMREAYEVFGKKIQDLATNKRLQNMTIEQIANIKNIYIKHMLSDPTTARWAAGVDIGILAEGDLAKIYTKSLKVQLGDAPNIFDNWKNSSSIGVPEANVSMFENLFNTPEKASNGELQPNPLINIIGDVASDLHKARLEGKDTTLTPEEESFQDDEIIKYMESVIAAPKAGQFSEGAVSTFTKPLLSTDWEKIDPSKRATIAHLAGQYVDRFFGSTKSGAFVPAIEKAYSNIVMKGRGKFTNLYELGVNPRTKGIVVNIAGDANIKNALNAMHFPNEPKASDKDVANLKKKLMKFADSVAENNMVDEILRATARVTDTNKEDITGIILNNLSQTSNLPINEAFIFTPPEPKQVEPAIRDVSDLDHEELLELHKQELLASGVAKASDNLTRPNGTQKNTGYFGEMMTTDGHTMTEKTIEVDGEDMPGLVPGLTKEEIQIYKDNKKPTRAMMIKARDHATARKKAGKDVYWQDGEEVHKEPRREVNKI